MISIIDYHYRMHWVIVRFIFPTLGHYTAHHCNVFGFTGPERAMAGALRGDRHLVRIWDCAVLGFQVPETVLKLA